MARVDHQFSQTKRADIPRSSFDMSHGLKTTFDGGYLVPILSFEVIPGDTINCRASLFGRLATPIKPVLDNMYLETFFFFVPYRQTWDNWVKFMGEQTDPGDSIDFVVPTCDSGTAQTNALTDFFGIPIGTDAAVTPVSALPFRAFWQIYNFWFRDENLSNTINVSTSDAGPDPWFGSTLPRRRKRRDYLTSCLPWPQKGDQIIIPIGDKAPVLADSTDHSAGTMTGTPLRMGEATTAVPLSTGQNLGVAPAVSGDIGGSTTATGAHDTPVAPINLYADLQNATSISINDLRESFQIQKLLERDARGGTRYPEILKSHFRVTDPGLLVHQRPLYLGGGSTMINITPVAQTTDTLETAAGDTPQGNLAGYGTVSAQNHGFTASFTEHGHIIGLVNVRADLTYQQGLERYWSRQTRYDFYWPVLSHIGEQSVLNKEIFLDPVDEATNNETFGYMPRYDEYRFKQSQITNLFRSKAVDTLDVWHLAQDFSDLPALNEAFILDTPPIDRVIAVPSEPHFLLDCYFKIRAARPLPLYATPGLIDHF